MRVPIELTQAFFEKHETWIVILHAKIMIVSHRTQIYNLDIFRVTANQTKNFWPILNISSWIKMNIFMHVKHQKEIFYFKDEGISDKKCAL